MRRAARHPHAHGSWLPRPLARPRTWRARQALANATAQNVTGTEEKYTFSELDKTTLTNIPSRDSSLWAHAVVTWAVTLVTYFWLWKCVGPAAEAAARACVCLGCAAELLGGMAVPAAEAMPRSRWQHRWAAAVARPTPAPGPQPSRHPGCLTPPRQWRSRTWPPALPTWQVQQGGAAPAHLLPAEPGKRCRTWAQAWPACRPALPCAARHPPCQLGPDPTPGLAWPGLNPVQPAGAESYTALCTDIPGVAYGTIPNRADGTLLKLIPKSAQLRSCLRCRLGRAACWAAAPCRRHAAVAEAFAFRLAPNRSVPLPLPLATRRHQGEGFRADGHAGKGCRRSGHRRRWCSHQDGVHQGRRGGRYAARCGGGWPRAVQASPSLHSLLGACMLTLALSVKAD